MPAYVVFFRETPIEDEAEMEEYRRIARKYGPSPDMTPVVHYGAITPLEGEVPDAVVILQFPTVEAAKTWYYGDAYQEALPHRLKAARFRAVIVEGV
jgi:uncharacterized protein (DUF1330 family)